MKNVKPSAPLITNLIPWNKIHDTTKHRCACFAKIIFLGKWNKKEPMVCTNFVPFSFNFRFLAWHYNKRLLHFASNIIMVTHTNAFLYTLLIIQFFFGLKNAYRPAKCGNILTLSNYTVFSCSDTALSIMLN